jgi:hypothetical protein
MWWASRRATLSRYRCAMLRDWGRHAYGAAAIIFGATTIFWHDLNSWQQIAVLGNVPNRELVVYVAAVAALAGGFAIQSRGIGQTGAVVLGTLYLLFALLWIPGIVAAPLVYDRWANFFEEFSIFSGAVIAYASLARDESPGTSRLARIGRIFFGVCVISFTLEQALYLRATADFVPKWILPGQMFWAITTTAAFALAAIAILSGRQALLASRLLTAMILLFGLVIWLPVLFANPDSHFNWAGNAQNLAIAASAWILADYLSRTTLVTMIRSA